MLNELAPAAKASRYSDDGGHWYEYLANDRRWTPLYAEGGSFSLREARVLQKAGRKAIPSVTTIFKELHKEQLLNWKIEQVLKTAHADMLEGVWTGGIDEWMDRIISKASGASMGAANLGTRIHGAIEEAINGREYDADLSAYVSPVLDKRSELQLLSQGAEVCVGSLEHGYAGRVDDLCAGRIVVDYKSRKWKATQKKAPTYGTDKMQLAAYGYAEWGAEFFLSGGGYIFVISTTEPGRVQPVYFRGAELKQAFDAFVGLTAVWRYNHNFEPRS